MLKRTLIVWYLEEAWIVELNQYNQLGKLLSVAKILLKYSTKLFKSIRETILCSQMCIKQIIFKCNKTYNYASKQHLKKDR